MPIDYARRLTGSQRTPAADRHLGYTLAFVAGAINAGGFLAVRQYTSHMTGIVSAMADNLAVGTYELVLAGAGALLSFVAGAMCTAILVNFGRRRASLGVLAWPLLLEAALLLIFGVVGASLSTVIGLFVPFTVMLLCFIMGLQIALVTKISRAEIRTTHITASSRTSASSWADSSTGAVRTASRGWSPTAVACGSCACWPPRSSWAVSPALSASSTPAMARRCRWRSS